jgi:hypothetical protein
MKRISSSLAAIIASLLQIAGASAASGDMLASGATVDVTPARSVDSGDLHKGDIFDLVVAHDVIQGSYVVIPRGTPGRGRVTWRTGKGGFGKSGKLEFDLVDLVIDGHSVPISGHYRVEGKGETGMVVAAIVIGGLSGGYSMKGHEAVVAKGSQYGAQTAVPLGMAYASDPAQGAAGLDPREAGRRAGQAALLAASMRN